ncbi:MAG: FecR domain-containing protein, partial [Oricola sp.]|nr:FecR domain-containing protein [Oricola sp.]
PGEDHASFAAARQEAIEWHVRVLRGETASPEVAEEFTAWRNRSTDNAAAYAYVEELWGKVDAVAKQALGDPEENPNGAIPLPHMRPSGRFLIPVIAASLSLLAVMFITLGGQFAGKADTYRTAVGEQKEIRLADGSIIMLNTATTAQVIYSRTVRLVRLSDGQASFSVAHDRNRPFIVAAAASAIKAVGTEFDVLNTPETVRVTLIEGAVEVASGMSERGAINGLDDDGDKPGVMVAGLAAGEQLTIERKTGAISAVSQADIARLMAWRDGRLNFHNTPLRDAIDEMNRYSSRPILLGDSELGDLPVSGVFAIDNSAGFASAIEALFSLESEQRDGKIVLRRKQAA